MLCGSEQTTVAQVGELQRVAPLAAVIFSPSSQYRFVRSRYSEEVSVRESRLREPELFSGANTREIEAKKAEELRLKEDLVNDETKKLEVRKVEQRLRIDRERVRQQLQDLDAKIKRAGELQRRITGKQRELAELRRNSSIENDRQRIKKRIKQLLQRRVEELEKLHQAYGEQVAAAAQLNVLLLQREVASADLRAADDEEREQLTELDRMKRRVTEVDQRLNTVKGRLEQLKREWEAKKREFKDAWGATDEEITTIGRANCELSAADLEARRIQQEAAAEAIFADEAIMREYLARKAEIDALSAERDGARDRLDTVNEQVETEKRNWLGPLRELTVKLDEKFRESCNYLGITGEAHLDERGNDFSEYEMSLKVSFRRGEEPQRLDAFRQSGGERSVVTILYILALHSLNDVCPLRVVDEMDQGMDEPNRRSVFKKMLEASAAPNSPQSFLLTPKLLPDLIPEDPANLEIFFIMNGPLFVPQRTWDTNPWGCAAE